MTKTRPTDTHPLPRWSWQRARWLLCALSLVAGMADNALAQGRPTGRGASREGSRGATTADAPSPARVERAKHLFQEGLRLSREERWAEARDKFTQARAIVERPSVLFNLAGIHYRLGELVAAKEALDAYTRIAPADDPNQAEVDRLRALIEPAIPELRLTVDPDGALVSIDGVARPGVGREREYLVDPGLHRMEVVAEGHESQRLTFEAQRGGSMEQRVTLLPVPVATRPPPDLEPEPPPDAPVAFDDTTEFPEPRTGEGNLLQSPWFWVATGAVAVVATVAIVAVATHDPGTEPLNRGTTGIVISVGE